MDNSDKIPLTNPEMPKPLGPEHAKGFVPSGLSVRAIAGMYWLRYAWRLFAREPFTWATLMALSLTIFGLSMLTPLGAPITLALTASICLTAHRQQAGEKIAVENIFTGFRGRFLQAYIVLSILQFMLFFVFILIGEQAFLAKGGDTNSLKAITDFATTNAGKDIPPQYSEQVDIILSTLLPSLLPPVLFNFFSCLIIPLIVINGLSVWQAIKKMALVMLFNPLAFVVYGFLLLIGLTLSAMSAGLGLLLFIPVAALTPYTVYRGLFYRD